MDIPLHPRLTTEQRSDLAHYVAQRARLQDIEAQAVIQQEICLDHIEAILDSANASAPE